MLIAALLALRPRVLVLDEPFANLDPHNVLRIRGLLRNLHAGGCGIVVCEHRLSRVVPDATRMVVIHGGRIAADGDPHHLLAHADETWGLEPHQVLLRPLVTEKGVHRASRNNQYAFEIHREATKLDVRRAVESLFDVKVVKVRTQTRKGKDRRFKFRVGRTSDWKKAIVELDADSRIDFF